jgi:hypothetical protein
LGGIDANKGAHFNGTRPLLALNVIHGAAKVWSPSDQQQANCAVGLNRLRSV